MSDLVLRRGRRSVRVRRRTLVVGVTLLLVALAVGVLGLSLGDYRLAPGEVLQVLTGRGRPFDRVVVLEWRAPQVSAGLVLGAALGVAGAVLQSITRNPLASPDVLGFSAGSYAGGLVAIIVLGGGYATTATGALVGGLGAALAVYLLAWRDGVQGFRLIVVGIGVTAVLGAVGTYLLLRARREVAMAASIWGSGSLGGITWSQLAGAGVVIVAALLLLGARSADLHQLGLGDDAAAALGVPVERTRLLLVALAVVLTAATVAAAGPIAFVGLAAPQLARRLTRSAGVALVPSALVGALVLAVSDLVGQHALPRPMPVGLVTVVAGGAYLVWLIVLETRRLP